jgi:hypothetical protein
LDTNYGGSSSDSATCIQQTTDKGYIIGGSTKSFGVGGYDFYLIKTDSLGNIQWSKTYGGQNDEFCLSVKQTADKGFIACGFSNSFNSMQSLHDSYLVKIDSAGNLGWSKIYANSSFSEIRSIVEIPGNGGYIFNGYSNQLGETYVVKINTVGDTVWRKGYSMSECNGVDISPTADGGYILLANIAVSFSGYNPCLIKINALGDTLWTRAYGNSSYSIIESGYSVKQVSDKGYIIGGYSEYSGTSYGAYLIKTDSLGSSGCRVYTPFNQQLAPPCTIITPNTQQNSVNTISSKVHSTIKHGGTINTFCYNNIASYELGNLLNIYPNPNTGRLYLSGFATNEKNSEVQITDVAGKIVYRQNHSIGNGIIELNLQLNDGIYFLRTGNPTAGWTIQRMIISR